MSTSKVHGTVVWSTSAALLLLGLFIIVQVENTSGWRRINYNKKVKVCFYIAVSSPLDRSKRFTLHPMTDLFVPTPTRYLWEAFAAIYCPKPIHSHFHRSKARYSVIQLIELGRRGENENISDDTNNRTQRT